MKQKLLCILLSLCLVTCVLPLQSVCAAGTWEITYSLTSNGAHRDYAKTGDEITVVFSLARTDVTDKWYVPDIYQEEILWDEDFFEYVPDSTTVIKDGTSIKKLKWEPGPHIIQITAIRPELRGEMQIGSFKLKVIGESGSGKIYTDTHLDAISGLPRSVLYDSNGEMIVPTCEDLEIFIGDENEFTVKVFEYVPGDRLVEVDGNAAGYSFNGNEMLLSENYGGKRVWITDALQSYTLEKASGKAKELIIQSAKSSTEAGDVGNNVNANSVSDGKIDFNDATCVHAVKNVWSAVNNENMTWFLNADVNADHTVDDKDIQTVLGAYSPS